MWNTTTEFPEDAKKNLKGKIKGEGDWWRGSESTLSSH